jgi:quinol-cytochrome oxidoreductase complex cytochrome b subunit
MTIKGRTYAPYPFVLADQPRTMAMVVTFIITIVVVVHIQVIESKKRKKKERGGEDKKKRKKESEGVSLWHCPRPNVVFFILLI